jgi:HD-like signal output (HDOD) protein
MAEMSHALADIVERIHTIPSLPEITTQVVRLAGEEQTTIPQLAAIMIKDAGMAAKILRMANSAAFALPQPVANLESALSLLGFKTIRAIALSVSVISLFQQQATGFNMRQFWFHNAVAAGLCREIAKRSRIWDPESAFSIGLLKDLGKVILVENMPDAVRSIILLAADKRLSFSAAAQQVIGTDDGDVAAWLCTHWGLDAALIDTIRYQHDLTHAANPKLAAMCMLADYLCSLRKIRISGSFNEMTLDPQVWVHLGMDKNSLTQVIASMQREIDLAQQLLQMAG